MGKRNFPLKCTLPCQLAVWLAVVIVLYVFRNESSRNVFVNQFEPAFLLTDDYFFLLSCRVSASSTGLMNFP